MNKHTVKHFILTVLITSTIISCKKDRIEDPDKSLNSYNSPDQYLDSKQQPEQEFVVENEDGNEPIQGNQETKIWITKDCLEFLDGTAVEFPYTVKLVELYTPKDMIYYRMPTVAGGDILETEGEIRLRAFKDNTELRLKNSCFTWVEMPSAAPKNYMEVYYELAAVGYIDWTKSPGIAGTPTPFADNDTGYIAPIYKLGWLNCGFKIGNGTGNGIAFTSQTDDLTNVAIFIYVPAYKSVLKVRNLISDIIPTGLDVKIICIALDGNGNLFHFKHDMNLSSNTTVDVVMTATTDPDLTALLDAL